MSEYREHMEESLLLPIRIGILLWVEKENEPRHNKTNKMSVRLTKTQIQPGHLPSLIRAFAVRSVDS